MGVNQISENDLQGVGVKGLEDIPGLSKADMQGKLEEISNKIIIPRLNNLISEFNQLQTDVNGLVLGVGQVTPSQIASWDAKLDTSTAYPVGKLYLSMDERSPASLFGGTWERIQDVFLLAAGSAYAAGTSGGEETHTLTIDEMPSHSHAVAYWTGRLPEAYSASYHSALTHENSGGTTNINETGGSQAHNNMPPYLAVYMWKRIA